MHRTASSPASPLRNTTQVPAEEILRERGCRAGPGIVEQTEHGVDHHQLLLRRAQLGLPIRRLESVPAACIASSRVVSRAPPRRSRPTRLRTRRNSG